MSDKNFKVKNGLTIQGTEDTLITADNSGGISLDGTVTADSFVGDGSGLTGISSYSAPTLGSTPIASGATVSTVAGLTLSNPTLTSSASEFGIEGSGTASWSSYPAGNPYGIKTINGQKRVVLPNVANFETMPIGSTVTFGDAVMNNGVGGAPTQQTLTTTGLYDGNGFNIAAGNDTSTSYPGGSHTFYISWTGTESAKTITADNLRSLSTSAANSVHHKLDLISNGSGLIDPVLNGASIVTEEGTYSYPSTISTTYTESTYPGGIGTKTVNGEKRFFIPSQYVNDSDALYNMPIGASVDITVIVCNNGVCGFYMISTKSTSLYDGSSFGIPTNNIYGYPNDDFTQSYYSLGINWYGQQAAVTIPAADLRYLSKDTAASLDHMIRTKKIVLEKFEGHPTNKKTTVQTTWTVPAGVYSIDATLIGGGGAGGDVVVTASAAWSGSSSFAEYGEAGGDTTITYNGVTYTAAGGSKGIIDFATALAPNWSWFASESTSSSANASTSLPNEEVGNNKPGRGGVGVKGSVSASNSIYKTINGVSDQFITFDRNNAQSGLGFDGEERHFTIPVVPGTNLSLSIGGNGQEVSWQSTDPYGTATSNPGAIYIRYVR
jgi:hypothetical protein